MDKKRLTSPCGVDCFNCLSYEGNITEDFKERVAVFLNIPVEETPCKGCRDESGKCKLAKGHCATWNCVHERGVAFCCECADFPCVYYTPSLEAADLLHNLKVYNLCRIKAVGIDRWIEEVAEIRKRYYEGRFVVGEGPVLEKD